ncbi:MAG: glutathionylspermidine synthase family protein [Gammaproteobacteria bacterium]|nr:glutathionylspermidine synthase family protein [Gammaproteobacteria bacterium]
MVTLRSIQPLDRELLEEIGLSWHTDADGSSYIGEELIEVDEDQAEAYYSAANELYEMYVAAAQQVIDGERYLELGIPSNLVELIEHSWRNDHLHLYGRFDLAGGLDGQPIKLIEFNADTPTSLFETSIVQWALLKANGMDTSSQFNNLHEMLQENFRRLITGSRPPAEFDERYAQEKLLFSSASGLPEDEQTVRYLQRVAHDAGFYTDFCYLHEAGFTAEEGVFNKDGQRADYWFKLFPWEDIAADELELTRMLTRSTRSGGTQYLNPPYTLLLQSKGMLKVLWEMFPDSPYLLPTDVNPLPGLAQVRKKLFGREGANMALVATDGTLTRTTEGPYAHHKDIYQARAQFAQDTRGNHYQAGVFFVDEACGLGFRRGGEILDNASKFVGHVIV